MSKMNGPTRKKLYLEMADGEGEFCRMCGVTAKKRQLVIDHKDNNNSNNRRDNRQFLCRPCNYKKNPRRPVDECVSEKEAQDPTEIQVNRTKEPQFKRLLAQYINENGTWEEKDLTNSLAEKLSLSPITIKRYLDKVCSSEGIYQRSKSYSKIFVGYKQELEFA